MTKLNGSALLLILSEQTRNTMHLKLKMTRQEEKLITSSGARSEIIEVVTSFKFLKSCSSEDGSLLEHVSIIVDEVLNNFGALMSLFIVRSVESDRACKHYSRLGSG